MKKLFKLIMILLAALGSLICVYWFNLDNKLIFYVVRPALNWLYSKQKRDVRL